MSIKFYDDCGDTFYSYGHEFGLTQVIKADSYETAFEIAIDESPTIDIDEIPEAYNAFDMMAEWLQSNNPGEYLGGSKNWVHVCKFIKRWMPLWWQLKCKEWQDSNEWPELDEAYRMQSNCTGSGIVNVGHYEWMRKSTDGEIAQISDDDLAEYLEDYGNELLDGHKFAVLNSWNGSINSMTYALQSSGELRRGTINREDSQVEHVHSIFWGLEIELEKCVDIALKATNANYKNNCDDCLKCKEWIGTDDRDYCDDCGFDPAGNDYDELDELLKATKKATARINTFRDILEGTNDPNSEHYRIR